MQERKIHNVVLIIASLALTTLGEAIHFGTLSDVERFIVFNLTILLLDKLLND